MKYLGKILEPDDLVNKKYVDDTIGNLDKYITKEEVYTKQEVDSKFGGVYRYCGTATVNSGNITATPQRAGDVYNIATGGRIYNDVAVSIPFEIPHPEDNLFYMHTAKTEDNNVLGVVVSDPENRVYIGQKGATVDVYEAIIHITKVDYANDDGLVLYFEYITPPFDGVLDAENQEIIYIDYQFDVKSGDNVVWNGKIWDVLAGTIDTSEFATKEELENVYTKEEVDNKVSSVYKACGSVMGDLQYAVPNPNVGDVYNVLNSQYIYDGFGDFYNTGYYDISLNTVAIPVVEFSYVNRTLVVQSSQYDEYFKRATGTDETYVNIVYKSITNDNGEYFVNSVTGIEVIDEYEGNLHMQFKNLSYATDEGIPAHNEVYEVCHLEYGIFLEPGDNAVWTGDHWDKLAASIDVTQFATKTELNQRAYKSTTLKGYGITDAYTKTEVDSEFATKTELNQRAYKSTTLKGYGITDAYTKTEVDSEFATKEESVGSLTEDGGEIFNDYENNEALGEFSHAEGQKTIANGIGTHAEGYMSTASGDYSHAEGQKTIAHGNGAHAEGLGFIGSEQTIAGVSIKNLQIKASSVDGNKIIIKTNILTATGLESALSSFSLVNGFVIKVNNSYIPVKSYTITEDGLLNRIVTMVSYDETVSTDIVNKTIEDIYLGIVSGEFGHHEGNQNIVIGNYAHAEGQFNAATGLGSHAEGNYTLAEKRGSHAEGEKTKAEADYSHAEGYATTTSGNAAHAEGYNTTASGSFSHAEGRDNNAVGENSHAEGYKTTANGSASHAEGKNTTATGKYSHAEGENTKAEGDGSHAEGYAVVASGNYSHAEGNANIASGGFSHAEGRDSKAEGDGSHAEGYAVVASGNYSHAEGYSTIANGSVSHAEGKNTTATGKYSHAEGENTKAGADYSHAEGYAAVASGNAAHAEGNANIASGGFSHAEGRETHATSEASHSEGYKSQANGKYSHSEGRETIASGNNSHAEGKSSIAKGGNSHAEGGYTIAAGGNQHVQGKYNIEDAFGVYVHIVGNGTSDTTRSNAHTLDWDGNAWFAGDIRITHNNKEYSLGAIIDVLIENGYEF